MPSPIQVGAILIDDSPRITQLLGLESEPYWGNWSVVKLPVGISLDGKIRASGWNFFFMAKEVTAIIFGALGTNKIQNALNRILEKVKGQHFNGLEVTGIVERRFLGVRYAVVAAHSRHLQQSFSLESAEARRAYQHDAAWARS